MTLRLFTLASYTFHYGSTVSDHKLAFYQPELHIVSEIQISPYEPYGNGPFTHTMCPVEIQTPTL